MRVCPRKTIAASLIFWSVILFTSSTLSQTKPQSAARVIWSGSSGGYAVQWTTSDINAQSASNPANVRYSAEAQAQEEITRIKKDNEEEPRACTYDQDYTLMSVVGSVISIQDHYYLGCEREAHPSGESRFVAVDLSKPSKVPTRRSEDMDYAMPENVILLTEIFREEDILRALLADSLIKKALAESENPETPKTLAQLLAAFDTGVSVATDDRNCYSVSEDLLTRFAFHHIEGDKVAVRIGLSGNGLCREFLTQIGILLPIPERLKASLANASAGKEGFLMKDQKRISGGQKARIVYETKGRAKG